jgi:hypothetical protein
MLPNGCSLSQAVVQPWRNLDGIDRYNASDYRTGTRNVFCPSVAIGDTSPRFPQSGCELIWIGTARRTSKLPSPRLSLACATRDRALRPTRF